MSSRRRFLQANILGLALSLPGSDTSGTAFRAAMETVPPKEEEHDYWNDWPNYVTAKMNEARTRRLTELRSMRTEADVKARVEKIRSAVWRLIGGPFGKTPLNPRTVGAINRGAYRIEKVIFESQPEIFVTANLYLPTRRQPLYPGIILPNGHAIKEGKAHRSYAYVSQTLARIGYVVLNFDAFGQGERMQYLDPRSGKPISVRGGEHSQAGRPMLLFGSQFEQYRTWDCIRAVDYLLSRPEVDPQRIGCTGQSGGGTMTMWAAALDPRIKVAVVSDGNSDNLAGPSYSPPGGVDDAEQNIVGSLAEGIDRGDLLLAFAPKPLLILYSRIDSGFTYSPTYVKGTKEVYNEVQAAYKLMGATDKVGLFGSPLPHDFDYFNRQQAYRWFNRWLGSEDWGTGEEPFDESAPNALNCTSTGQVLTSLGGRSVVQLNADRLNKLAPVNPLGTTSSDATAFRGRAQGILKQLLALPAQKTPVSSRVISSNTRKEVVIEEIVMYSEPLIRVGGWFLRPAKADRPLRTIVFTSEGSARRVPYETSEMGALVKNGFAVCAVDLRGLGDSIPHYPIAGPVFYTDELRNGYAWACFSLGKPVMGQRVWDFLRCLDYLESRSDVDQSRIYGVGEKGAALAVLLAAVLDSRLYSILLDSPVATYRSIVESKTYSPEFSWYVFDILKHFDLPDLVRSLAPQPCWLLNAANSQGETLSESEISLLYKHPSEVYKQSRAGGQLRFVVYPEQEKTKVLQSWLQAV
jgi:cephalosporin-C deacetylase-like acetyl esterase